MQPGEKIATYDLGSALRGKSGKFEVTSPSGEIYHVICKANHSASSLEWAGSPQPFMVRRVADAVSPESGKELRATQTQASEPPFLLDSEADDGEPLFAKAAVVVLPKAEGDNLAGRAAAGLELVYMESHSETKRPTAWVAVKGEGGIRAAADQVMMTARCATFNELDAEVRKLHAQLDEIRARAKKRFYVAHAAAATA
jgi:hypothetical protein